MKIFLEIKIFLFSKNPKERVQKHPTFHMNNSPFPFSEKTFSVSYFNVFACNNATIGTDAIYTTRNFMFYYFRKHFLQSFICAEWGYVNVLASQVRANEPRSLRR